jgi:hypothetical protein
MGRDDVAALWGRRREKEAIGDLAPADGRYSCRGEKALLGNTKCGGFPKAALVAIICR